MTPLPFTEKFRSGFWISLAYWAYFAALGCFLPFFALYLRQLGMSGGQTGVLMAILPVAGALLAPVWGIAADRSGRHRLILCGAAALSALAAAMLARVTTFPSLFMVTTLLAVFNAPLIPLLDSHCLSIGERAGISYGQLRLWGSIGFTSGAGVVGWLMGGAISSLFITLCAGALALCGVSALRFPALRPQAVRWEWGSVGRIVRDRYLLVVLLAIYLTAWGMNAFNTYFAIYITELGGSVAFVGSATALGSFSELPFMALGARWARAPGSRTLLAAAIVVFGVRFFLYSALTSVQWILPLQLLHGVSFAFFLLASVALVHQRAGAELAATAQSLLASTVASGQITGALVGGLLLDRTGVFDMIRAMGFLMVIALVLFAGGLRWLGENMDARDHELDALPSGRREGVLPLPSAED